MPHHAVTPPRSVTGQSTPQATQYATGTETQTRTALEARQLIEGSAACLAKRARREEPARKSSPFRRRGARMMTTGGASQRSVLTAPTLPRMADADEKRAESDDELEDEVDVKPTVKKAE